MLFQRVLLYQNIIRLNQMFRDAFNKVQNSGSNIDFGTTKAAKYCVFSWFAFYNSYL